LERFEKGDGSLEQRLARMLLEAGNETDLKQKINHLGSSLSRIRDEVVTGDSSLATSPDLLVNLDSLGQTVEVQP
jgi:hypothetical protein